MFLTKAFRFLIIISNIISVAHHDLPKVGRNIRELIFQKKIKLIPLFLEPNP